MGSIAVLEHHKSTNKWGQKLIEEPNAIGMSAKVKLNLFEISRGKSTSKNKTIVCYFYVKILAKTNMFNVA